MLRAGAVEEVVDEEVIEASNDDGESEQQDDATEYTEEVEAVEDDSEEILHDVTIDGKAERWTLSSAKAVSAAGQAIFSKMRENAEQSKQIEAQKAQLAQQQQAMLNMYNQMQQGNFTPPTPPSKELLESDPIEYMQEKEAYETAMVEHNTCATNAAIAAAASSTNGATKTSAPSRANAAIAATCA